MESREFGRQGLANLERRIEAKYRELARQELERELQRLSDEQGRFSPLNDGGCGGVSPQDNVSSDGVGQG